MNRAAPKRPRRGPPSNVYRRADSQKHGLRPPGPSAPSTVPSRAVRSPQSANQVRALDCALKEVCGACEFVNTTYNTGLQQKYHRGVAVLKKAGVIDKARLLPPVPSPKPLEYRSLFKLAVRPKVQTNFSNATRSPRSDGVIERFDIGLFEPGTHKIVSMNDCPLHTLPLQRLVRDLSWELNKTELTPYDEKTHTGQLRYIAARAAHLTGEIMLTFVINDTFVENETPAAKEELKRLVDTLRRKGHTVNSAHINFNPDRGNAIFAAKTQRIAGADRLRERLCELDFEVGPTSFFQVNPWQAINLYRRVEQITGLAPNGSGRAMGMSVAWDLYCGTGQISLLLARAGYRVLGIEENPEAIADASTNARKNRLHERSEYIAARVEDSQELLPVWARSPSLIVVNPSRRGLAESTRVHLAQLLEQNPQSRFVYVSCEVETLARDLKDLMGSGFTVRQVEPFDMFPQTDKMEWIAVMTK